MGPGILPSLEEGAQSNPDAQAPPRRKGIKTLDTLDRVRTDTIRFALMNLGDPHKDRPMRRSPWGPAPLHVDGDPHQVCEPGRGAYWVSTWLRPVTPHAGPALRRQGLSGLQGGKAGIGYLHTEPRLHRDLGLRFVRKPPTAPATGGVFVWGAYCCIHHVNIFSLYRVPIPSTPKH